MDGLPQEFMLGLILALFAVVVLLALRVILRWQRLYSKKTNDPSEVVIKTPSPKIRLEKGGSYLVPEDRLSLSMEIFAFDLKRGLQGLCITRTFPERIRTRFKLGSIPIIWLTRTTQTIAPPNMILAPTKLGMILEEIKRFIRSRNETIVLFDGLEYLTVQNEFERVLRFVHELADEIALNEARLLISYNPEAIEKERRALIEGELKLLEVT